MKSFFFCFFLFFARSPLLRFVGMFIGFLAWMAVIGLDGITSSVSGEDRSLEVDGRWSEGLLQAGGFFMSGILLSMRLALFSLGRWALMGKCYAT